MKRGIVLAAAALGSFALTMAYMQERWDAAPVHPEPIPRKNVTPHFTDATPPRAAAPVAEAPAPPVAARDDHLIERRRLEDFAGGISQVAPMTEAQKRAILEAKLRHKKAYELILRDSGIERETLSLAERTYAHQTIARALKDYQENYLLDVRTILNDEQYVLLRDYESTEFEQELARLQTTINSR
jgi:hypothetical protein